jgi:long-subunit fatty acid transport protein
MKTTKLLLLTAALATSLLAVTSTAQAAFVAEWPDIFGIDFRFNNPGARANAMGGAFIGLADDATAAYTNPAGLTILTKPEVTLEYKYGKYTNLVFDPVITGSTVGHKDVEYPETLQGLSFLSYVYPTEKATFAVYRHQLMNQKTAFGFMSDIPANSINVDMQVEANTLGFGLGVKASQSLSFGVSAGFTEMQYEEHTTGHEGPLNSAYEEVDGRDQAVHYTASLLWQPSEKIGIGLVYRQGPEFSFRKKGYELTTIQHIDDYNSNGFTDFGDYDTNGDGVFDINDNPSYISTEKNVERYNFEHNVKMPDVYGLGLSYRPLANLTISTDVNYVEYTDLEVIGGTDPDALVGFENNDTYEVHVGLEYVLDLKSTPLALRCGYFYKPAHNFHVTESHPDYATFNNIYPEGETEHIYSLGFGALLSDNVQIDLAGTFGDLIKEGTMSLVYRFE